MTDRFDDGFKPAAPPHPVPEKTPAQHRHPVILRASAVGVAGILSALMLTAVVPPIVADQSDRAVVDAPVMLLTSPIAGQVETLSATPGGEVRARDRLAQITNSRLDRTTLISLEEKAADARQKLDATRAKHQSDITYVASLDQEIDGQAEQLKVQLQSQIEELRARVAQSNAQSSEKKAIVDRQNRMVARDAASLDMVKPTEQQYAAALHDTDAQNAKLNQKQTQLKALNAGIYVGEDLVALNMLGQKRRDIDLDARRMQIEEKQQSAVLEDLERLIKSERERLARLASADVLSPGPGKVLAVGAETGRHVSAGDTIASVVDCDKRFVVAIFSYRQGETMKPGTKVRIDGGGFHSGVVSAVLPKTSDKVDERFAVPFPQTERRELYLMITPDAASDSVAPQPASAATPACTVGQWVTVTRDNGIVPSMSVTWRRLGHLVASLTDLDPSEPGEATRRAGVAKLDSALRSSSVRQPDLDEQWLPTTGTVSAQ
ncbi:HlyD family secretion protein [Bradyrhizobium aeschynomenes]|uniref:HlyD family secretion protein n=1 Tax=Bradyrhizobium aeschynomenes TaxID=2734909 RepID=UPI001557A96E|nr:HlyD family efflux transporter periplasmic adaptor subunit [Bradyrhizobium aeschynomenes]NPV19389.1 HlyD family efflux transporter periplasmic adaptor subunit [Bradyrhizobium aeschynomenes]